MGVRRVEVQRLGVGRVEVQVEVQRVEVQVKVQRVEVQVEVQRVGVGRVEVQVEVQRSGGPGGSGGPAHFNIISVNFISIPPFSLVIY